MADNGPTRSGATMRGIPGGRAVSTQADPTLAGHSPALSDSAAEPKPEPAFSGKPVHCLLRIAADDCGVIVFLTGLAMLERQGIIELDLEMLPWCAPLETGPFHLRDKAVTQAELVVEGRRRAIIDTHDGWEIDPAEVERCDAYFKRSFRPDALLGPHARRIHALGLTSKVRADGFDTFEMKRILRAKLPLGLRTRQLAHWFAASALATFGIGQRANFSRMHLPPTGPGADRVLCMGQLWDPETVPASEPLKRIEFERLNAMRVECIQALRRAFGERFYGGIKPSAFARRTAPDVVFGDESQTKQRSFLREVARHPICVTSTGLHGSTGTRMSELVAFSRAIVSEPLLARAPGDFGPERNYLEFTTPEQCVERAEWLLTHPRERAAMMERNWRYFCDWLRADRFAWRVIALTRAS